MLTRPAASRARTNPPRSALEKAEDCLMSASGMCTATTMLLALVPAGGHIVTTTDCYRRTRQFIQTMLPKMGITVGAPPVQPARRPRLRLRARRAYLWQQLPKSRL